MLTLASVRLCAFVPVNLVDVARSRHPSTTDYEQLLATIKIDPTSAPDNTGDCEALRRRPYNYCAAIQTAWDEKIINLCFNLEKKKQLNNERPNIMQHFKSAIVY